jgi:transcriptional regulator with XRE-family HTH domain
VTPFYDRHELTATTQLVEEAGFLRSKVRFLGESTSEIHQQLVFDSWQRRTNERGKLAPKGLLEEIANLGFSWRDVARMVGVSVPAIQKWRRDGGVTGENRRKLASLLALCDEITEGYHIQEVASWFEMPITAGAPVTPIDLYADGQARLVMEHASEHSDGEAILTAYDENWRERYRSDFEVYLEADSAMSIRSKKA